MVGSLYENLPDQLPEELITVLAENDAVKIERIVSDGHQSEVGSWYDQEQNEWVLLVSGSATLEFEDQIRVLKPGDHMLIPAHRKHRVAATSSSQKTIWLAVFFSG